MVLYIYLYISLNINTYSKNLVITNDGPNLQVKANILAGGLKFELEELQQSL